MLIHHLDSNPVWLVFLQEEDRHTERRCYETKRKRLDRHSSNQGIPTIVVKDQGPKEARKYRSHGFKGTNGPGNTLNSDF